MILSLILLPIITIITNYIFKWKYKSLFNIFISIILLYISLYIYIMMNNNSMEYQWREEWDIRIIRYIIGIDGINLSLIILINIIYPIILWITKEEQYNSIYSIYIVLIIIFLSLDIIGFFIFFEVILIPMFILVGIYGSQYKRIEASYRLLLFTYLGSLLMLIAIIYLYIINGNSNIEYIIYNMNNQYNPIYIYIWILLIISFLIKLPTFPFHIWLPIVHVESPTIGSIILAGILLKIASYGILRFNISIFNYLNYYYLPIILILILISIYYSSLINIRQIDLKKIIAYSSIIHMNFTLFGLLINDLNGFYGSLFSNISHGIIASALFYIIGILYIRYHTRILLYYRGLINIMSIFSIFIFFFILHNIAIPLSSSFISELFLLFSSYNFNIFYSILICFSLLFSTIYNIVLLSKLLFSSPHPYLLSSLDLSFNEFLSLSLLLFFSFLFGIFPNLLLHLFTPYILPLLY